ncbi:tetraspanin-9-like [Babylonia areolata]|uniref:tetraspanin-9-like n=1 Tax=Babylonia areolata TaxID=304850 RepID=UPI003FD43B56
MGSETGYKVIRGLFIFFNFLGIVMGIAMVAVGAYLYVEKNDFLNLMPKYEDVNITAVMIAAGIVVLVIAFIGFCGAWMESQCMLIMFFTFIFIIFAMEIAVGVVGFIYRDEIDQEITEELLKGIKETKRHPSWNNIQEEFECCGVEGAEDWIDTPLKKIPDSCCIFSACGGNPSLAYKTGCYTKVKDEIEDNFYVLGAAGIALGVLQLILLVMTMVLLCAIRRAHSTVA